MEFANERLGVFVPQHIFSQGLPSCQRLLVVKQLRNRILRPPDPPSDIKDTQSNAVRSACRALGRVRGGTTRFKQDTAVSPGFKTDSVEIKIEFACAAAQQHCLRLLRQIFRCRPAAATYVRLLPYDSKDQQSLP